MRELLSTFAPKPFKCTDMKRLSLKIIRILKKGYKLLTFRWADEIKAAQEPAKMEARDASMETQATAGVQTDAVGLADTAGGHKTRDLAVDTTLHEDANGDSLGPRAPAIESVVHEDKFVDPLATAEYEFDDFGDCRIRSVLQEVEPADMQYSLDMLFGHYELLAGRLREEKAEQSFLLGVRRENERMVRSYLNPHARPYPFGLAADASDAAQNAAAVEPRLAKAGAYCSSSESIIFIY